MSPSPRPSRPAAPSAMPYFCPSRSRLPCRWPWSAAFLLLLAGPAFAQEVRRAEAVTPPTARAVPFDSFEKPTPKPALRSGPPTIIDENGPHIAPAPPEARVSASGADEIQFAFANDFYSRGL